MTTVKHRDNWPFDKRETSAVQKDGYCDLDNARQTVYA